MKGTTGLWIFCVLLFIGVAYNYMHTSSTKKIAFVKSADIMNGFTVMKSAREQYQVQFQELKARVDTLSMELQKGIETHEKNLSVMSQQEKQDSEKALRAKQQQFLDYQKAIQEKAQKEDQKITQSIVKQVNVFLENYGKENNYAIVFGATEVGNIVYAQDAIDVTEDVLAQLNDHYEN